MSRENHQDILIGTLASMDKALTYLPQIVQHGFESFQLTNWQYLPEGDLDELGKQVQDMLAGRAVISSVGLYGNPLTDDRTAKDWERLIRSAKSFGAEVVCGFAGAVEGKPVDESMPRFIEVFGNLAKVAEDCGVKIAFENCDMGGSWELPKWNIAHSPRAWEMMFDAVPGETLGLEWEPCHQMVSLIDPLPQLKKWVDRVYHIHGKDASIEWDVLKREGLRCGKWFVWHRTPGFGDTNWTDVISILRKAGWKGAIDIEGWHDPVYKDDLEMTGQVHSLNYLRNCRGGTYIPNPKVD
ncbi:MAG: sugar phosphate isomerase/epimerase [Armatimonadetes bacterium]|nr:sugar phosphate isomerase/epimerase [Armatimonadota bacterium]